MMSTVRQRLLGISPDEASFAKRGFKAASDRTRQRLEKSGSTFVLGYNEALRVDRVDRLADCLEQIEPAYRGFGYEGAAMALALLDTITPWNRGRFEQYLHGPARNHVYMVHIGAGWAAARLKRPFDRATRKCDGLMRWLVADGYGFHEAFFSTRKTIDRQRRPSRIGGYAQRAFDQGVGRCLWFVNGAEVDRVTRTVNAFPAPRRGDLWTGVGLACTYAGADDQEHVRRLRDAAAAYLPQVAQGSAFAAKARLRAGNPVPHTEMACRMLCDMSGHEAADITDVALIDLPADDSGSDVPGFEIWRRRIQNRLTEATG